MNLNKQEEFKELLYRGNNYIIGSLGSVFKNNKELNQTIDHDGYLRVTTLDYNTTYRRTAVHRLIAFAFLINDNPNYKKEVNHKDYDRTNNNVDNLEWISHADNVRYSICNKPDMSGINNPNYGNKKLSNFYNENPDIALVKQSRKGLTNGRCTKIKMYKDNCLIKEFDYISLCCQYFIDNKLCSTTNIEGIRSQINKSIRNKNTYKGYYFTKES